MDILNDDIREGQFRWECVAKRQVCLAVALRNLDGVVDIADGHGVVGDVVDTTWTAAALEITGQGGRWAGPNFDAGTVASVGHGNVVDEDVLHDVGFCGVLS